MNRLPEWVMTNKFPSVYDSESGTAIEMVAKVYGAMQGIIEEHNKIADETEKQIEAFEKGTTDDIAQFKQNMTSIMAAHIKSVETVIDMLMKQSADMINEAIRTGQIDVNLVYNPETEQLELKTGGV